jgi:endo-1,4-beta-D-glucanase Y
MKFRERNEFELVPLLAQTTFILQTLSGLEARRMKRVKEYIHANGRNANHRRFLPHFCENFHRYFNEECCLWDPAQRFILLIGTHCQTMSTNVAHCIRKDFSEG